MKTILSVFLVVSCLLSGVAFAEDPCMEPDQTKMTLAFLFEGKSKCFYLHGGYSFSANEAENYASRTCTKEGKLDGFNCSTGTGVIKKEVRAFNNVDFYLEKGGFKSAKFKSREYKDCDITFTNNPTQTTIGSVEVSCPAGFASAIIGKNKNDIQITAFRGETYNKGTLSAPERTIKNVDKQVLYTAIIESYLKSMKWRADLYPDIKPQNTIYNYFANLLMGDDGKKVLYLAVADKIQSSLDNNKALAAQEKAEKAELERLMKKYENKPVKKDNKKKFSGGM